MQDHLSDTAPEAQAVVDARLRRMTAKEKFRLVDSMSSMMIFHAKRAIRRAFPDLTDQEVDLRFVEQHYGKDLADGMRQQLSERSRNA